MFLEGSLEACWKFSDALGRCKRLHGGSLYYFEALGLVFGFLWRLLGNSSASCKDLGAFSKTPWCSTKLAAGQLSFNSSLHVTLVKTMLNLLGVVPKFPRYGSHALYLCSFPHQSGSLLCRCLHSHAESLSIMHSP